jgi:hypothetical protein
MVIAIIAILPLTATAQALTTAETLGEGAQAVALSENHLFVDGVELNVAYVQYVRGLTSYFDLYGSLGVTGIFGEQQKYVALGGNLHLVKLGGLNFSLFNVCAKPIERCDEASTVLLNSAIVVSYGVNDNLWLYSGANGLFPIGNRDRGLFTPLQNEFNVPVGVGILIGKLNIFAEGDIGHQKALGILLAYSL